MAFPEVDSLHDTLMRFAERTNELVCSANNNLERLVSCQCHHLASIAGVGEHGCSSSLTEIMHLEEKHHVLISLPLGSGHYPVECLTSVREPKAPSLHPTLPIETLDGIFRLLTQQQLLPVLLSNRLLYQIARRRFYHTVSLRSPRNAVAFLMTTLHNPELATLVRSFELSVAVSTGKWPPVVDHSPSTPIPFAGIPVTPPSPPQITHNFYFLLHRGLCAMNSLRSLTLELPKSHSPDWIFDGCTFMLSQFTTSVHCKHRLANFLEKQNTIEDMTLRGFQNESLFLLPFLNAAAAALVAQGQNAPPPMTMASYPHLPFSLSPSALPRLKSFNAIHAGPEVIRTVMQGRSVEVASTPLFPGRSIQTLEALGAGQKPLRRLSVISFDPGAPEFLFGELAVRFKDLEALHLVLLMADYSNNLFEDYRRILPSFTSLKYITFMAASSHESPIDEVKVARDWHHACPTLRTIILPKGSVWFQGEDRLAQHSDASEGRKLEFIL